MRWEDSNIYQLQKSISSRIHELCCFQMRYRVSSERYDCASQRSLNYRQRPAQTKQLNYKKCKKARDQQKRITFYASSKNSRLSRMHGRYSSLLPVVMHRHCAPEVPMGCRSSASAGRSPAGCVLWHLERLRRLLLRVQHILVALSHSPSSRQSPRCRCCLRDVAVAKAREEGSVWRKGLPYQRISAVKTILERPGANFA